MKATSSKPTISIAKAVSCDLAFRYSADRFFAFIESLNTRTVVVDFRGVSTISRSFAHQYMLRKNQSVKTVTEINVSADIRKMFHVVQRPKTETEFVEIAEVQPLVA